MVRSGKLLRAQVHEVRAPGYQEGLQAMWEDRWARLGHHGRVDWIRRHGAPPPALCPLVCLTCPLP